MTEQSPRSHWLMEIQRDFEKGYTNGCVGTVLVSETEKLRVWHLHIPAGKRCSFHRHVLNYFWTSHSDGSARGYFEDGTIVDVEHYKGETRHLSFGPGEYMVHSVENTGKTDLLFTTVEFLDSPNEPLAVPDAVRLQGPANVRMVS
jgi:hypothetical protein